MSFVHREGPDLSDEDINKMVQNPRTATDEQLHSRIALYGLVGYNRIGATLRGRYENAPQSMAPWSWVMRIQGGQEGEVSSSD